MNIHQQLLSTKTTLNTDQEVNPNTPNCDCFKDFQRKGEINLPNWLKTLNHDYKRLKKHKTTSIYADYTDFTKVVV